jgi:hypothetical protein
MLVTANVVPSSLMPLISMKEATCSSETSLKEPHGTTSLKKTLFIVAVVKVSNITYLCKVNITRPGEKITAINPLLMIAAYSKEK